MSLDKSIRILLLTLSDKYKITIIELTIAKDGKISKTFRVSYELLNNQDEFPAKEEFKSKRDLVRWLMCLK